MKVRWDGAPGFLQAGHRVAKRGGHVLGRGPWPRTGLAMTNEEALQGQRSRYSPVSALALEGDPRDGGGRRSEGEGARKVAGHRGRQSG